MNTETGYTLDKHVLFIYIANCIYYYNIYIYIYIYIYIFSDHHIWYEY